MEVKAASFDPWCSMVPVSPSAPLRGLISPIAMGSGAHAGGEGDEERTKYERAPEGGLP